MDATHRTPAAFLGTHRIGSAAAVRAILSVSTALLATLGSVAPAQAQEVTVAGYGTLTALWWHDPGGSSEPPTALQQAFPIGSAFTASFTYDPADQTPLEELRGWSRYAGAMSSWSVAANGHLFSGDPEATSLRQIWVGDGHPEIQGMDGISSGVDAIMDGSGEFAGFEVVAASFFMTDAEGTELDGQALPTEICLGAWERILFQVHFYADGLFYFLDGSGVPDRSIDSDGDTLSDTAEIHGLGTDPCAADTDGDGAGDGVDPDPLVPEFSASQLAEMVRDTATSVIEIPEAAFEGPNENAERGKRNALANRLQAAANALEDGDLEQALEILTNARRLLDGDPSPPDSMEEGPLKDDLLAEIDALIAYIEATLAD